MPNSGRRLLVGKLPRGQFGSDSGLKVVWRPKYGNNSKFNPFVVNPKLSHGELKIGAIIELIAPRSTAATNQHVVRW